MELSQEQRKIIDHVAAKNGFIDYEVIAVPGSIKGENFLGVITSVTIKDGEKTLDLILKSALKSEALRKLTPIRGLFEREIFLYNNIFKEFNKFEEECGISENFSCFPKFYDYSDKNSDECLVMENLKNIGYQLWDKKTPMNSEHLKAVLKEYAKFHSISFAMKDKKPEQFDQLGKKVLNSVFYNSSFMANPETLDRFIESSMKNAYKVVEDNTVLIECLKKFQSDIREVFLNYSNLPKYQLVVVHGDCWCNNFLFKYKDIKNPVTPLSLRIIDWQISYISTPAMDFAYFFLVHSTKEILEDYKTYINIYYDALSSRLRKFNCDPEKVYSFQRFNDDLKIFMKFGLYMSLTIIKLMLCDSEEAPDLSVSSEDGNLEGSMTFEMKNYDVYKERILSLIHFLKDNCFI